MRRSRFVRWGIVTAIALAACGRDVITPPPSKPAVARIGSLLESIAVATPDADVNVQIEFASLKSTRDVTELVQREGLKVHGVTHGFTDGTQVQIGVYDVPQTGSFNEWLAGYHLSTTEFLNTAIRLGEADVREANAKNRPPLSRLLGTFKKRLDAVRKDGPTIYAMRVNGKAAALASLQLRDASASRVTLARLDGSYAGALAPAALTGAGVGGQKNMIVCPYLVSPNATSPSAVSTCPDPTDPPPPDDLPPPMYSSIPVTVFNAPAAADPWDDNTTYDDNSVNNSNWAPRRGKSYIDRDNVGKYSYEHVLWSGNDLTLFRVEGNKGSFELETHQDERFPRRVYGKGFYEWSGTRKGVVWDSNFPNPYLDSQFGDGYFAGVAGVQNIAVGSNGPEQFATDKWYYTWVRHSQFELGNSTGEIQIAVQLGNRWIEVCRSSPWCTLRAAATVRVMPWMCNYKAPNSISNYTPNKWKRWYYDRNGYKNEFCSEDGY